MSKENQGIITAEEIDKLFCLIGKKYNVPKLVLKAIAVIESALDPKAYRYEPAFWEKYLKDNPNWNKREKEEVSASYGLMQMMYVVACEAGFKGEPTELYNPVFNIDIGAKIFRRILDNIPEKYRANPIKVLMIALARYNGGAKDNPDSEGNLRNSAYATKVFKKYCELYLRGEEC